MSSKWNYDDNNHDDNNHIYNNNGNNDHYIVNKDDNINDLPIKKNNINDGGDETSVCLPRRLELKPQVVKCFASASPNCCCQFAVTLASDRGHTTAVSVVRFTLADDTCGCPKLQ